MAALLPVVGNVTVPRNAAPRVSDLGYRVEAAAAGQIGLYIDAGRDCAERARVAAVFIALALNPPTFQSAPPRAPAVPGPVRHRWFQVGAAARIDAGNAGSSPPQTAAPWGGELTVAAGHGPIGGSLSAGVLRSFLARFNRFDASIAVREQRFPFSAAVRAQGDLPGRLRLAAELGAALVLARFRAEGLQGSSAVARLDVGLRGAVALRLPVSFGSVAPFVGLHAEYFPKPYQLDVDPVGTVGTSTGLWLGASAGLSFGTM